MAHGHQRTLQQVERLKAGDRDGHTEAGAEGLVLAIAHDSAYVAGAEERLHAVLGRLEDEGDGRRDQRVRHQNRNVVDAFEPRAMHQHGVRRGGGLEADGEEDDLALGMGARDLEAVERRIDDAYVGALRLEGEQVAGRTGHAQHVAEGAEDHIRTGGDGVRLVDGLERGDADRAAGAVHQLDAFRQHAVKAVADDGVRLAAADLHDHPRARLDTLDLGDDRLRQAGVAVLIDVLHCGFLVAASSTTGASSSVSWSICSSRA